MITKASCVLHCFQGVASQDGSESDIPATATSDRKGEKRRLDVEKEDVDSKRKRECPGNNNEGTNGSSKSGFLLDRFHKTQGHKKLHIKKNSRPFFSR